MQWQEFNRLSGRNVSYEMYGYEIEPVYMHYEWLDKFAVAEMWSGKNAYGFYFWLNLVDLRRNKMAVEKSDLDECYKKLVRENIEKKTREVREKIEEMMRELA